MSIFLIVLLVVYLVGFVVMFIDTFRRSGLLPTTCAVISLFWPLIAVSSGWMRATELAKRWVK